VEPDPGEGVFRRAQRDTQQFCVSFRGLELVTLLTGWRSQAVRAAREQGASWEHIGEATGVSAEQAEADYAEAIARQRRYGSGASGRSSD